MFEFFRFELRQQFRTPLLWLMAAMFALLGFLAFSTDGVSIVGGVSNVHRNAPVPIALFATIMTLFGMLYVAMAVNGAFLRDFECGTAELIFVTPMKRRNYVIGRFFAALGTSFAISCALGFGMLLASFAPWVDKQTLGPVMLWPYVWTYLVMVLPNLLLSTAVLSLLAIRTRGMLWVYVGVLAFIVLYFASSAMARNLDNVWLAVLSEPLGIRAFGRTARYWTAEEQNTRLPQITGYILANRALWLSVAAALFAVCVLSFKAERTGTARGRTWLRKHAQAVATHADAAALPRVAVKKVAPRSGWAASFAQYLRIVRFDTMSVLRAPAFLVMLKFAVGLFLLLASFAQTEYGNKAIPVTSQMLMPLFGGFGIMLIIVVAFYAGELFGRERSAKLHEVVDAMPVANTVPLAAKFTALLVVIFAFLAFGVAFAMLFQLSHGYTHFEFGLYVRSVLLASIGAALWAGLSLAMQVFGNNKFLGYGLVIAVLGGTLLMPAMHLEHHLYNFGSSPDAPYSDMNGFGHFLPAKLWFDGYWALFVAMLLLLSAAFWARGNVGGWHERMRVARERLRGRLGFMTASAALGWVGVGGFLYWNTNILNDYRSSSGQLDLQARYERDFRKYLGLPQPRIFATHVDVDLRPENQTLHAVGTYRVRNPSAAPLSDVHVLMEDDKSLTSIDFGGAKLVLHDDAGYRIYRLDRPMAPGETRDVKFVVDKRETGILHDGPQQAIVENGTFVHSSIFPSFGYNEQGEIQDRDERRKRGLGEPHRVAKLEDQAARANTYISHNADWIDFSTTVCTAPDQIALSPGYLRREFVRDGRRCFDYAMDRPMLNFYSYLSARWQVRKALYGRIPVEIYYDAQHPYNVDRMIDAVRKSLAYYEANFTPYQFHQVRIIEFPQYAAFAQSFANTIPYSESVGFISDLRRKPEIDNVFYITAHEVGHQWWAHQVIGADVQGATMLSESLAQYSALMVMEKEYGRAHMRRFLKYELDQYLAGRSSEREEEQPLYRNEGQPYIRYQKASLVFYRLRDEIGEETLNRALKKFLLDKGYQNAPYTTSQELLDYIRREAGPQHDRLISDLFEKNTVYDDRVESATAKKRADGKYDVTLTLRAAKVEVDGKGKETTASLDDWIEVGVFARAPSGKEEDEKVLYLQRHRITGTAPKITVVVDGEPYEAGFDPYNKLIDRVSSDNRKQVTLQ